MKIINLAKRILVNVNDAHKITHNKKFKMLNTCHKIARHFLYVCKILAGKETVKPVSDKLPQEHKN